MKALRTSWRLHKHQLRHLRHQVFILEQNVPLEDEWDDKDDNAIHYLLIHQNHCIGCARVIIEKKQAKIGRVCVLRQHRQKGAGSQLMHYIINDLESTGIKLLELDAQTYIIPWYESMGFDVCSDIFMDAGIPHIKMKRGL